MKKIIVANFKMNKTEDEISKYISDFLGLKWNFKSDVVICPPFTSILFMAQNFKNQGVCVGAQNCHYEKSGAFTGEISAEMIKNIGARYVILGHSERRCYFNESNEIINKKIKAALGSGLTVILCVGENKTEREKNKQEEIVTSQIKEALKDIENEKIKNIIVAYEPIWAIGTGNAIIPEDAEKICKLIKEFMKKNYQLENSKVLYGGSLKSVNAEEFFKMPSIDGGLIGGASLDAKEFAEIIKKAENI